MLKSLLTYQMEYRHFFLGIQNRSLSLLDLFTRHTEKINCQFSERVRRMNAPVTHDRGKQIKNRFGLFLINLTKKAMNITKKYFFSQ